MILLAALAFADPPLSLDLDGDGRPESIVVEEMAVRIGPHRIECSGESVCEIEAHDISGSDSQREVAMCQVGTRDWRSCRLYTLLGGQPRQVVFPGGLEPEKIVTNGTGIVLTEERWRHRLYTRVDKFVWGAGALTKTRQPFYAVGATIHVDRTFPITFTPAGTEVVANARPDTDVQVLVEHADQDGWVLLRLSTGIVGWVEVLKLIEASDQFTLTWSAG